MKKKSCVHLLFRLLNQWIYSTFMSLYKASVQQSSLPIMPFQLKLFLAELNSNFIKPLWLNTRKFNSIEYIATTKQEEYHILERNNNNNNTFCFSQLLKRSGMTTTSFHAKDNLRKKKNILWVSAKAKTHLIREKHEKNNLQSLTWNPQEVRTSYHCSVFATLETLQENKLLQTNYTVCKNIYRLLFKAF